MTKSLHHYNNSCPHGYLNVSHHTTSAKHKAAVAKVIARERKDTSIVDALQNYEDKHRVIKKNEITSCLEDPCILFLVHRNIFSFSPF